MGKTLIQYVYIALAATLLSGCYTSQVAVDTVEKANEHIAQQEKKSDVGVTDEMKAKLTHLFSDMPEYAKLAIRDDSAASLPRLRSSVPPKYPLIGYLANTKATVKVAFIISEGGKVEDARVYEASDDRFSESALKAVRKWKFYPGSFNGIAAKFMVVVPVQFDGRK